VPQLTEARRVGREGQAVDAAVDHGFLVGIRERDLGRAGEEDDVSWRLILARIDAGGATALLATRTLTGQQAQRGHRHWFLRG